MKHIDRDQLLAQVDLIALADEVLGPHHGRGPSRTWPCPDPLHGPQTGRTPPVSIFVARDGHQRYHCHACGAGGTAIDLVLATHTLSTADAIDYLARRVGLTPMVSSSSPLRSLRRLPTPPLVLPPEPAVVDRAVETYVGACEELLWTRPGAPTLRWLRTRGFGDEILRANRVGADPGPKHLHRAAGLPRGGPAAVLPVLDGVRHAVYLQARYLDPDTVGRKYDNPSRHLATNPRLATITTPRALPGRDDVIVCEGIPDALTIAQTGRPAVAILGAGLHDRTIAEQLTRVWPDHNIVVAFDADPAGQHGATVLADQLRTRTERSVAVLDLNGRGDLNQWATTSGRDPFARELDRAIAQTQVPAVAPSRPVRELVFPRSVLSIRMPTRGQGLDL